MRTSETLLVSPGAEEGSQFRGANSARIIFYGKKLNPIRLLK